MSALDHEVLMSSRKVHNGVMKFINRYKESMELGEINAENCYAEIIKEMKGAHFWNIYCTSNRVCMHIYKKGSKAGSICGAKIFISANVGLQKFKCSRHCRDYDAKNRVYNNVNTRCNYIRTNGLQCKHKCSQYTDYCYIHKDVNINADNKTIINVNNKIIINQSLKKLKKKKIHYFKSKYEKKKLCTQFFQREGQGNLIKINKNKCKKKKKCITVLYIPCECTRYTCMRYERIGIT